MEVIINNKTRLAKMKKLLKVLWALPLTALLAVGCQSEDVVYNGGDYVMFSDSVYTLSLIHI